MIHLPIKTPKRVKLSVYPALIWAALLPLMSCSDGKTQAQIESLLGVALPEYSEDVMFEKKPHSSEFIKPYNAYIKAHMSEDDYIAWVKKLGLTLKRDQKIFIMGTGHLKPSVYTPEWWNPVPEITQLTAYGDFQQAEPGLSNSISATYQNGIAYVNIFESGGD